MNDILTSMCTRLNNLNSLFSSSILNIELLPVLGQMCCQCT